jgi:hypothetical protein
MKPTARLLNHVLAGSIVAGNVFLSGVFKKGDAKDIDARCFYVAAKCWAAGKSPYDPTIHDARFLAIFGSHHGRTVRGISVDLNPARLADGSI